MQGQIFVRVNTVESEDAELRIMITSTGSINVIVRLMLLPVLRQCSVPTHVIQNTIRQLGGKSLMEETCARPRIDQLQLGRPCMGLEYGS